MLKVDSHLRATEFLSIPDLIWINIYTIWKMFKEQKLAILDIKTSGKAA